MHDDLTSRSPKSYSVMAFRGTVLEAAVKRGRGRERERKKGKKREKDEREHINQFSRPFDWALISLTGLPRGEGWAGKSLNGP